jgi:N-acetylglucosamine-6-sulfatase
MTKRILRKKHGVEQEFYSMSFKIRYRLSGLVILFFVVNMTVSSCAAIQSSALFKPRPNVIIILTDDMDFSLMPFVKNTENLIGGNGATFTNYFVTSPLCCPSRSSMIRGQYPHNTHVLSNDFPAGSFRRFFVDGSESETLAVWLKRSGYQTSLIGKYLNGYPIFAGHNYVPAGWTDWHALFYQMPGESGNWYNGYTLVENGPLVKYDNSPQNYSTDVFKEKSIKFIDQSVASGKPFFLLLSLYAPHGPSIPAIRHSKMLEGLAYPKKPSFSEIDISDKPNVIQSLTKNGDEIDAGDADSLYLRRAQTMLAVDELVTEVVKNLEQNGQLDNTYIFFTSDNGFGIGEHQLSPGKGLPYEEDIHVPLLVRGPGIKPNTVITQITANIDLAPTITDIAGANTAKFVDGRSMMPLFQPETSKTLYWRKGLLIEMGAINPSSTGMSVALPVSFDSPPIQFEYPDSPNDTYLRQVGDSTYRGIRSDKFLYVEYNNGEIEFYNLIADPHEMDNLAAKLDSKILSSLHTWLEQLQTCAANDCRKIEASLPSGLENYH